MKLKQELRVSRIRGCEDDDMSQSVSQSVSQSAVGQGPATTRVDPLYASVRVLNVGN